MTNDPTTGEIVRAFRGAGVYGITTALELRIIDRLEAQERTIAALTSRAEQAEKERDALLTDFSTIERDGLCEVCFFGDSSQISKEDCMEDCCFNYRTRRGLQPQEGEGK